MLTSGVAQYLHPDYFEPLPTTLDAKKSPLALLAQTCSSIGKDTTSAKPIIPPIEKKEVSKTPEKSVHIDNHKRPRSTEEKDSGRDSKPGFRTITSKPSLAPVSSASENTSKHSKTDNSVGSKLNLDLSPTSKSSNYVTKSSERHSPSKPTKETDENMRARSLSPHHHSHKSTTNSTSLLHSPVSSSESTLGLSHSALLAGIPSAAHYGYPSFVNPYDAQALHGYPAYFAAHASLSAATAAAAAQNSVMKANAAASAAAAMSPYVAYTRVRTPSGATTLVPVCRDPYCSNCQLSLQSAHVSSTCNIPGCSQCAHEKSLLSLSNGFGLPSSSYLSSLSAGSHLTGTPSLNSLYAGSALVGHQGLPFICNWVAGSEYCGKRFSSSEELLQHLRTHTSSADAASLSSSFGLGLTSPLSLCHSHIPGAAPPSPTSLRRAAYPQSISPVSLLASNRYHPYKSPLTSLPPAPGQPYAPLSPYCSPYGLYAQRLGAAAVP